MALRKARGEQAVSGDDWKIEAIGDGDQHGFGGSSNFGDGGVVTGIDGGHPGLFEDDLRLVVTQAIEFVRERVPFFLRSEDAHRLLAPERNSADFETGGFAATIDERVVGERRFGKSFLAVDACVERRDERLGHGNFVDTVLGKRHADRVANSVIEQ